MRQKVSDADFLKTAMPLILKNAPMRKIAAATGLSLGGVQYKLMRLGIKREQKYVTTEATRRAAKRQLPT